MPAVAFWPVMMNSPFVYSIKASVGKNVNCKYATVKVFHFQIENMIN